MNVYNKQTIINLSEINNNNFNEKSLELFRYQYINVPEYQRFCNLLDKTPSKIKTIQDIPFVPVELFKTQKFYDKTQHTNQVIFTSSGTTSSTVSKHFVASLALYEQSFNKCFEKFYGDITQYNVLALLPSYLERSGSSLIYMVDKWIENSKKQDSKFYLNDINQLAIKLTEIENRKEKTILIGVSFALLNFIEKYQFSLENTIIMETGGMKGRRKELTREELHSRLQQGFGTKQIHSEYGMTELLSQAYACKEGKFYCPNWMKIQLCDTHDPFNQITKIGKTGKINIIDLANQYSCAFIATQDLGRIGIKNNKEYFEVLGRFDNSDIRGCNLMIT